MCNLFTIKYICGIIVLLLISMGLPVRRKVRKVYRLFVD